MKTLNKKAFTLVELIMVMAVVAILVTVLFVSTKPQKRFGEANDAKRKNDAQSLEQAIKLITADAGSLPLELNLTENQAFALVKAGGTVEGTYSCTALGTSINKVDISSALSSVLPAMPIDPELSEASNETGYYIVKRGRSYDIEPCNTYALAATSGTQQMCGDGYCGSSESCSSCAQDCGACPAVCGNGVVEGNEACDDGDVNTESCGNSIVESGGAIYCSADCSSSITLNEQCDDGNSSNLDSCLNTCMNISCGDTYCNGSETCANCSSDCGTCQEAYTMGPNYAGSGFNAGFGDVSWSGVNDIVSDNSVYATVANIPTTSGISDVVANLIKANGTYSSQNRADHNIWSGTLGIKTYGGEGDL
jgi:prepilin-type N-terminal cleavage/methylation domain-containing protein